MKNSTLTRKIAQIEFTLAAYTNAVSAATERLDAALVRASDDRVSADRLEAIARDASETALLARADAYASRSIALKLERDLTMTKRVLARVADRLARTTATK